MSPPSPRVVVAGAGPDPAVPFLALPDLGI